jgi:hypothetical protein
MNAPERTDQLDARVQRNEEPAVRPACDRLRLRVRRVQAGIESDRD